MKDLYNELVSKDDNELRIEEHPHHGHPETKHIGIKGPSSQTYRLTILILGILCVVLMSTIIGLCISYKGLGEKHFVLSQNSSEIKSNLDQLKANYSLLTVALMKVQRNFQEAVSAKDLIQLERDRERERKELLLRQAEALRTEERDLQARIDLLEKSCSRCSAGWELLKSSCYFISPADTGETLSWHQSREECKKTGADLAVIDTQEKQEFIWRILKGKRQQLSYWHLKGYWMGLSDIKTESAWKWVNGAELTNGFWIDGEPNDQYAAEDCAATYPKENPLETWNDAPCGFGLKWICEIHLQEP